MMKKDIIPDNIYGLYYMHYCDVLSNYIHWFKQKPTTAILQYHHIKPKALYPALSKRWSNLICVSPTLHIFLHTLLHQAFKEAGRNDLADKYNVIKNIVTYTNNETGFNGIVSTQKYILNMSKAILKQICLRYFQVFAEIDELSSKLESMSKADSVGVERYVNCNGFISALQRRVKADKMTVEKQHELIELLDQVQTKMRKLYDIEKEFTVQDCAQKTCSCDEASHEVCRKELNLKRGEQMEFFQRCLVWLICGDMYIIELYDILTGKDEMDDVLF